MAQVIGFSQLLPVQFSEARPLRPECSMFRQTQSPAVEQPATSMPFRVFQAETNLVHQRMFRSEVHKPTHPTIQNRPLVEQGLKPLESLKCILEVKERRSLQEQDGLEASGFAWRVVGCLGDELTICQGGSSPQVFLD
jgi:hypothetical protein